MSVNPSTPTITRDTITCPSRFTCPSGPSIEINCFPSLDDVRKFCIKKYGQNYFPEERTSGSRRQRSSETRAQDTAPLVSFITINPNDKLISFQDFKQRCEKWFKWNIIQNIKYTYEVRSRVNATDTSGCGIHIHALVRHTNTRKDLKDRLCKDFKRFVGNRQHIDIKYAPKDKHPDLYYQEQVDYMLGKTKDKTINENFRKNFNLQKLYTYDKTCPPIADVGYQPDAPVDAPPPPSLDQAN